DVALLEELGSETYVYANLADDSIKNLDGEPVMMVARSGVRSPARLGDGIRLRQSGPAVHLFHPETGNRL
ncbi:sugar ABC transporter ATP-binding protein, partial [Gordonia sp. HY442]|nr:sugar ABC transporter ATP-binding protein [Gordonia zhenghanii]MCF8608310.1 sugar ABC transporter ATP-binding protein [Gordonia zhenghanii]